MTKQTMTRLTRRRFLQLAALGLSAALARPARAVGLLDLKEKAHWRMAAPWGPGLELLRRAADHFAQRVSLLTQSRLAIDVYTGGPEVGPEDVAEALASGRVDCAHCAPGLWTDRFPALEWFGGTPFGLDAAGHGVWFYQGDGLDLWTEACRPLNAYPLPLGDAGPRLLGWSRQDVRSLADLAGLRARLPEAAGRVLALAGARVDAAPESPAGPPFQDPGPFDLVWSLGPHDDLALGAAQDGAHACLAPGLLPSRRLALLVNRDAYNALHPILRRIIDAAAAQEDLRLTAAYAAANAQALEQIRALAGVRLSCLSGTDMDGLRAMAAEAMAAGAPAPGPGRGLWDRIGRSHQRAMAVMTAWT